MMADCPELRTVKQIPKTKPRPATPSPTPIGGHQKDSASLTMDLMDLKAAIDLESVKWRKMIDSLDENIHTDGAKTPQILGSEHTTGPRVTQRRKIKVRDSQSSDRLVEQSLYHDQLLVALRNLKSQLEHIEEFKAELQSPVFKWESLISDLNNLIKSSLKLVHDLPYGPILVTGFSDTSN